MIKYLKKMRLVQGFLALLGYVVLLILFRTYRLRITYLGDQPSSLKNRPGIFYFWHQNILSGMFFFFKLGHRGHCMVSPSSDGQFASTICERLGFTVLRGSTYKNPVTVTRQALQVLEEYRQLCVVGDGSRGPAFQLQPGIIALAAKTGVPLVYVECKPQSAFTITKSWDKFQIPYPFSIINVHVH